MSNPTEGDPAAATTETGPGTQPPFLRVIRGDATEEEVAALVAVLSALGVPEAPPRRRRPEWNAPRRLVRRTPPHGPGAWRASGLPR